MEERTKLQPARMEEAVRSELTRMITDLNEVHMKLDALLAKMVVSSRPDSDQETFEQLRRSLDRQLVRIREKLTERLR